MDFRYIKCVNTNHLIQDFFEINVNDSIIPLSSKIIPTAQSHIVYYNSEKNLISDFKNKTYKNTGLVILGQSYKSYTFKAYNAYSSFGINFHPTALYKILKTDLSKLTDKHLNLSKVDNGLYNLLNPVFKENLKGEALAIKIENQLLNLELHESKNTKLVDDAIKVVYKKEGKINVEELLKIFPVSQKHLENQFKKIIGLTPLKFIKLYKFLNLMKKYQSNKESISQLIDYYGYYDLSHFTKDFKLFMNQKPSEFFKCDNIYLNNYLKP